MGWHRRSAWLGLGCALVLVLSACSPSDSRVDTYVSEYGGSRAQYERIEDMTECESVQAEYEPGTDAESWNAGYMAASEDRLEELDCPRR
jgi:hypothetical protein